MPAPKELVELVERFERNRDAYRSGRYNETQLRQEFVNPLFELLGWDMNNRQGFAEQYKDVVHEDRIAIGFYPKAPDYAFRIGGARKFFVETKTPSKDLKDDPEPAFQLRRYAWSAKLPLSILTDFEEFAVYDCRIKPAKGDKASVARILYLTSAEYVEKWDDLAAIFAREAVLKGSFDAYAESKKKRRGTAEVDEAFLGQIEQWRELLAKNLALRNGELGVRELNFAVQRIIDRIVFLRICEDRGIEQYGQLQALLNAGRVYARLGELFHGADQRYNSGLFHFRKEKGRSEAPDELTLGLDLDDKVLKDIIGGLYYPESPYEFSVLPADILGQVYERFLGKVIRLTVGHQAKVEQKPEVRKAGGVYYTPTYIVDYIVEHTVGKLLEEAKTPKKATELKILDPACGSGSFLIGAYQKLLDWHRDWYVGDGAQKYGKGRDPRLYQGSGGDWRLTAAEKKRILTNNIFGVDIDQQAVEVTKLSLLLKVLEGESAETLESQLRLFHERALPDLGNNIKCGNSLIAPDFYRDAQIAMLDDEQRYRINVFDWQVEFQSTLGRGDPGFDAVVGNPPWGAEFSDPELEYLREQHRPVIVRMIDSFIFFGHRALGLTRSSGFVGLVLPGTVLNQRDATRLRAQFLDRGPAAVVNIGQGVFGRKVLNTSAVIIVRGSSRAGQVTVGDISRVSPVNKATLIRDLPQVAHSRWSQVVRRDPLLTFFVNAPAVTVLLEKLRSTGVLLRSMIDDEIQRGVTPDVVEAHVLSPTQAKRSRIEAELLRTSISGRQLRRYSAWEPDRVLLYTSRETPIREYPRAQEHLSEFRNRITCKEVAAGKHPWWALHRPRDTNIFRSPKLVGLTTSKRIELIYDEDASIFVTDAFYVFKLLPGLSADALVAILQSRVIHFAYQVANQGEGRVIPQIKAAKLYDLPFPNQESIGRFEDRLASLARRMIELDRKRQASRTAHDVTALERQIAATDRQIDQLVYELYGLTDEEIRIVEEATAR